MSKSLDADVELELRDPTTRAIVFACARADEQRLDNAVYTPLERRYTSSSGFFGKLREPEDPIDAIERLRTELEQIRSISGLIDLLSSQTSGNGETQDIRRMLELLESTYQLFGRYDTMQRQFYAKTARAVKSVASARGISHEQVVNRQEYMDDVMGTVFPTRQDAQEYFDARHRLMGEMLVVSRGLIAFAKMTGQNLPPEAKLMPTEEVSNALIKSMSEYRAGELNRIYGKR